MKKGDTLLYFKNGDERKPRGKLSFVSYWPGFQTKTIELNEAGEAKGKR